MTATLSGFAGLTAALDRLTDTGRTTLFWWRDDDAVAASPALDRLLNLARSHAAPLALAVIPARLEPSLAQRLTALEHDQWPAGRLALLQHGYSHTNNAPDGEKKCELGPHRPLPLTQGDLATGWAQLEMLAATGIGPARLLPVLVPPWNRIAPGLIPALPEMSYVGLSRFGRRLRPHPIAGLSEVNSHIDPVDWRGRHGPLRAFVGEMPALAAVITCLRAGPDEPLGLLTHHRDHDEDGWRFIDHLLGLLRRHPAARLVPAVDLFRPHPANLDSAE